MHDLEKKGEEVIRLYNRYWVEKLCYGTINGRIRFDQIAGAEFLQEHHFHKLKTEELHIKDKIKYVHINGENVEDVEEVDREYVKYYILSFLIYNGSEKLRNYLVDNSIFIAPNLLDCLRERIPYDVIDDKELIFLVDEGNISVTNNGMYLTYVRVKED